MGQITQIIVGHDGSAPADRAFGAALDLAHRSAAVIHVVATAIEWADLADPVVLMRKRMRERFDAMRDLAASRGVATDFAVIHGFPSRALAAFANECGADLILLGSRRRSGWHRAVFGSISERVARNANCAVAVAR